MSSNELYQELILDHFRAPRNKVALIEPSAKKALVNPLCGDNIEFQIKVLNDQVLEVGYQGTGCSLSQASASMLTELLVGKSLSQVAEIQRAFESMMKGSEPNEALLGDSVALVGVRNFAARLRCVTLAWEALERCLIEIRSK
jgi:nitrogen fixation NifU-like protein